MINYKDKENYLDKDIFPNGKLFKSREEIAEYIFKDGSKTFYNSSRFFPKSLEREVAILYSFVRIADNYVDVTNKSSNDEDLSDLDNRKQKLDIFINIFYGIYKDDQYEPSSQVGRLIIKPFVELIKLKNINLEEIKAFFESMLMDFSPIEYLTIDDTLKYIYGSAEVIGLMMAKILNLKAEALEYAKMLGRSFQFINFIRDIGEDQKLGRSYFPKTEIEYFGLKNLSKEEVFKNEESFKRFLHYQLERYKSWQTKAKLGFIYLPTMTRVAITTASDMYNLTAKIIYKDPMIVFSSVKVKPSKFVIVTKGLINLSLIILKISK